jgi:hypothetical protein
MLQWIHPQQHISGCHITVPDLLCILGDTLKTSQEPVVVANNGYADFKDYGIMTAMVEKPYSWKRFLDLAKNLITKMYDELSSSTSFRH